MSRIPAIRPAVGTLFPTLEQVAKTAEAQATAHTVPPSVLSSWDTLRQAYGAIAPQRLAAGRAKVRAFHGLVR